MKKIEKTSSNVKFFLNLAKVQTIMTRRLDGGLGGISLNEFVILYHLNQAGEQTLRRIDLAEKIGLTASGVTRLLLPMEKIGLVKSGENENDARVRCVKMASGGKMKFKEALERIEILAQEIIPSEKKTEIKNMSELLLMIMGRIHMR